MRWISAVANAVASGGLTLVCSLVFLQEGLDLESPTSSNAAILPESKTAKHDDVRIDENWELRIDGLRARLFDEGGRKRGMITASFLGRQSPVIKGLIFVDHPKISAEQLVISVEADEGIYRPAEFFEEMLQRFGAPSPRESQHLANRLAGIESGEAPIDTSQQDVTDGLSLWRLDARQVEIKFLGGNEQEMIVSADDIRTGAHNRGFAYLSGNVQFSRGDMTFLQAERAAWSIQSNVFYVRPKGKVVSEVCIDCATLERMVDLACVPWPDNGWVCSCSASFPAPEPDPLMIAASRIRSRMFRQLGFCDTFLGDMLCSASDH